MVSPLCSDHNKPEYGQLYVFDASKATEERNEGCLPSVMERLDSMLREINPFIEFYLQISASVLASLKPAGQYYRGGRCGTQCHAGWRKGEGFIHVMLLPHWCSRSRGAVASMAKLLRMIW
ncbi:hypothetical protein AVEN_177426-1 [Araneus ventricosus]|uniref:Uncharacterized protein n=1 Tax=Araneus ventricosus TaxID=182803 RepID=A0A4Y2IN92_ARAVE|nr:hypothetical protein AVEN_177426-1 [Araneus ventricosus]